MNKKQIFAKMKALATKQQDIINIAKGEERDLTDDEIKNLDEYQKDIDTLKRQADILEKMEGNDNFLNEPTTSKIIPVVEGTQEKVLNDFGFKSLGEFVHAVRFGDNQGRLKDLTANVGESGGIMIPERFIPEIKKLNAEASLVRPRAQVIPAGNPADGKITLPVFSQGSDGVFGGVEVAWTGEGKEIKETDNPKIKEVSLEPKEVSGLTVVSDKLLRNWEAADTFITNLLRGAMDVAEDNKFINGSGVGCPLGFLNSKGAIKVDRDTTGIVKYIDIVTMMSKLLPESLGNAIFVINQSLMPIVATMKDDNGNYIFIQGDATKGLATTLCGIPIRWTTKNKDKGNEGDVSLVDLSYYLIKDGSGPYISASEHVLFRQNKTVIKVIWNTDGQSWVTEPLTCFDGVNKVSPFVILR